MKSITLTLCFRVRFEYICVQGQQHQSILSFPTMQAINFAFRELHNYFENNRLKDFARSLSSLFNNLFGNKCSLAVLVNLKEDVYRSLRFSKNSFISFTYYGVYLVVCGNLLICVIPEIPYLDFFFNLMINLAMSFLIKVFSGSSQCGSQQRSIWMYQFPYEI